MRFLLVYAVLTGLGLVMLGLSIALQRVQAAVAHSRAAGERRGAPAPSLARAEARPSPAPAARRHGVA